MYIWPKLHFTKNLFARMPECTFGRNYISPKTCLPEFTLARMYIWPKLFFPKTYFPECTFGRNYISRKKCLPKFILAGMYLWPKLYFCESLFSRIYTKQNLRLVENTFPRKLFFSEITFLQKFIFWKLFFFFFFFFLHCPLFREDCGGSSSRLSRHTSRSSITSIISLGRSPKRFHPSSLM